MSPNKLAELLAEKNRQLEPHEAMDRAREEMARCDEALKRCEEALEDARRIMTERGDHDAP